MPTYKKCNTIMQEMQICTQGGLLRIQFLLFLMRTFQCARSRPFNYPLCNRVGCLINKIKGFGVLKNRLFLGRRNFFRIICREMPKAYL